MTADASMWQCRSSLGAAWVLSSLSASRATTNLLPVTLLVLLVYTWIALYSQVPVVRRFGDEQVAKAYNLLPEGLQDISATVWHLLLPDILLHKVCGLPSNSDVKSWQTSHGRTVYSNVGCNNTSSKNGTVVCLLPPK
jgi:hypothetical protein